MEWVSILPLALIVLACPLLMLFMHRGHAGGHGQQEHAGHGAGAADPGDPQERLRDLEKEVIELRQQLAAAGPGTVESPAAVGGNGSTPKAAGVEAPEGEQRT